MRFVYLDGIRGIAALFVLARHWDALFGFGFYFSHLAVDVFFILSGFVIAHAYDEKLRNGSLSGSAFMSIRLARLYPVYALAVLVSLAVAIGKGWGNGADLHLQEWVTSAFLALLFLPSSVPGSDLLFPLNICFWSLFAELLLNGGYAYGRRWLTRPVLVAIAVITALMLVAVAAATNTMSHGYRMSMASVGAGLIRAAFGIAVGLLLYQGRARFAPMTRNVSPWVGVALLMLVMMFPAVPERFAGAVELIAVITVIPVAILVAAAREPTPGFALRSMLVLGISSYPIYLLHMPVGKVLEMTAGHVPLHPPIYALAAAVILVALSLLIERYLDIPARKWLRTRLQGRRANVVT